MMSFHWFNLGESLNPVARWRLFNVAKGFVVTSHVIKTDSVSTAIVPRDVVSAILFSDPSVNVSCDFLTCPL